MRPSIEARNISVVAGDRWLLRDLSLRIDGGELVVVVGPNGAGKSTLLAALAGDRALEQGQVFISGEDVAHMRPRQLARERAVLPQQAIIQFAFTCREIVEMGRAAHEDDTVDSIAIEEAMAMVDIADLGDRLFPSLSVGEQARVTLARVLAQDTMSLLLDEPTAALDLRHQQMVMQIARKITGRGAAILAILHDLNLAAAYADRIVLLRDGRIFADGTPWETLTEQLLERVFDCPVMVTPHPQIGCPLVVPHCPVWPVHADPGREQSMVGVTTA